MHIVSAVGGRPGLPPARNGWRQLPGPGYVSGPAAYSYHMLYLGPCPTVQSSLSLLNLTNHTRDISTLESDSIVMNSPFYLDSLCLLMTPMSPRLIKSLRSDKST